MTGKYKGKSGYVLEKGKSGRRWKKRRQFNFIETAKKRGQLGAETAADYDMQHKDADMQHFKGKRLAGAFATMMLGGPASPFIAHKMYKKTDSDTIERMRALQTPEVQERLRKDALKQSVKAAAAVGGGFAASSVVQAILSEGGMHAIKNKQFKSFLVPAALGAHIGSSIGGFASYAGSPHVNSIGNIQDLAISDTVRDRAVKNALKLGLDESEAHSIVDMNYGERRAKVKAARETARGYAAVERGVSRKEISDEEADQKMGQLLKDLNKIRKSQGKKPYSSRAIQEVEDKELVRGVAALFGDR